MAPVAVCFACVKNAGRSQMSAGFFNELVDPACAIAVSAGSAPADAVQPEAVAAMADAGIDISACRPKRLTAELLRDAGVTLVVTMGCGDKCPYVPGVEIIDWKIPDPHGQGTGAVHAIRDTIRGRVLELAAERGWRLRAAAGGAAASPLHCATVAMA